MSRPALSFVVFSFLLAPSLHAQASVPSQFEFIGITSPIAADSGVLAMTAKCQSEFTTRKTRMCKTTEIADSLNLPAVGDYNSSRGWVRPVPAGTFALWHFGVRVPMLIYVDAAAQWRPSNSFKSMESTCFGWSSVGPTFFAYVVGSKVGSSEGRFGREPCSSKDTGVACCGPSL